MDLKGKCISLFSPHALNFQIQIPSLLIPLPAPPCFFFHHPTTPLACFWWELRTVTCKWIHCLRRQKLLRSQERHSALTGTPEKVSEVQHTQASSSLRVLQHLGLTLSDLITGDHLYSTYWLALAEQTWKHEPKRFFFFFFSPSHRGCLHMASAALHLNYNLLSKPKCSFMNQKLYLCVFGSDAQEVECAQAA